MLTRPPIPLIALLIILLVTACSKFHPMEPEEDSLLDGPMDGLSGAELSRFIRGDDEFHVNFTQATGLGPLFVSTSCGNCHAGDGRGHPFNNLIRFGQSDATGNHFLDQGGPQLQHRALPGYTPESIPAGAPYASFIGPPVTGLGLLDAITDDDILSRSDPSDSDGDGISGRPNWMQRKSFSARRPGGLEQNGLSIGRFGRKASVYDLLEQTAIAYQQDMGIVSTFLPIDPYTGEEQDPEISNAITHDVVFYLRTLKAPIQRNMTDPTVISGEQIFNAIGCESCHRESFTTGNNPIGALANITFRPFTDMLMHDMGPGLDDGYTEGTADSNEWRTAPLWGLGLSPDSQGGSYYLLHDGRATSIAQAIQLHGGEAQASTNAFNALNATDREALIKFLESL